MNKNKCYFCNQEITGFGVHHFQALKFKQVPLNKSTCFECYIEVCMEKYFDSKFKKLSNMIDKENAEKK